MDSENEEKAKQAKKKVVKEKSQSANQSKKRTKKGHFDDEISEEEKEPITKRQKNIREQ